MGEKFRVLLILTALLILGGCTPNPEKISNSTANLPPPIKYPPTPNLVSRIAFGSCNKYDLPQPLWQPIVNTKPDLWIWLGDIVYASNTDISTMQRMYEKQKANPGYRLLLQTATVIGVWDDHDYGKNNGGKEYPYKEESQQQLLNFLDEPLNSPRRKQKGVYAAYTYGQPGKQVKVFLLDTRYHREEPGNERDILGEEQWAWLEKELRNSKAQVNLIASGIQIIPEEHQYEKWANFPKARQRLFDLIAKTKVPGVIFLSGDRHFAEISKIQATPVGYPLYEVTASGLTHSWEKLTQEANRYRLGNFFKFLHFGMLEIDWSSQPVRLKLQIRDRAGKVQLQQTIPLSELQPSIR